MTFVHLHVHSGYSLLDGCIKPGDLAAAAKDMDMPAVALTDHGQMSGLLEFYRAARRLELNPILGVEAYVAAAGRRSRDRPDLNHHLVLLAENFTGYRNLCRLISRANAEGFHGWPRLDKELLTEHGEGLIALSACLKGELPWLIMNWPSLWKGVSPAISSWWPISWAGPESGGFRRAPAGGPPPVAWRSTP